MKIKIINSCVGKDGEHLEAGSVVDYPDDAANHLIRLGRAKTDSDDTDTPGGDAAAELQKHNVAELKKIAEELAIDGAAKMNKATLITAILAAQQEE